VEKAHGNLELLAEMSSMCIICVDIRKDKLTSKEARRNLGELYTAMERDHIYEVLRLIWRKEDQEYAEEYENNQCAYYGDTD
jgi:hypothetical protein